MFRTILLVAALLAAGQAFAADQPAYAPEESWILPVEVPQGTAPGDGSPLQVLLADSQTNLATAQNEYYHRRVTKILSPQGLSLSGQLSETWDPATEELTIHHLTILRAGSAIDLLAGGRKFLVLRRESNLELAMLDGRLTATLQPEGLEVGDIVDFAYTLIQHDPALGGHSAHFDALGYAGRIGRFYSRTLWPAAKPVHWRETAGIDAPRITQTAAGTEAVVDMSDVTDPKPPNQAPFRFQQLGSLEFSDFHDWGEVSSLMAPLYEKAQTLRPESPLRAEIARIADAAGDPKARATAALRLVEDRIRYMYLGLNDGGLVPADADETWSRRFGDCKGKSVLLVALLRGLGLDAQVAAVSTQVGDGLDQRLPVLDWFDHVIVRLRIGEQVYWLDGTRLGDLALDDLTIPNDHWALPIQPGGGALVRLDPPPPAVPVFESRIRIDASKGIDLPSPTHVELIYRSESAVNLREELANEARGDFDRGVRQMLTQSYPWLTIDKTDVIRDDDANQVSVTGDGTGKLEWETGLNGGRYYRVHGSGMGSEAVFKREPGLNIDAPFVVRYPSFNRFVTEIAWPPDGEFALIGADVEATIAGQEFKRTSRTVDNVLRVERSARSLVPEFPAAEAEAAGAALRALPKAEVIVGYAPRSGPPKPPPTDPDADRKAAERDDPAAQYRLGMRYGAGDGLPFDIDQARTWLRRSADQGYADAQVQIGLSLAQKDAAEAVTWYRKAADQGHPRGETMLALALLTGQGVPKNPREALGWLTKAADQGDAGAAFELSGLYQAGADPDVAKNEPEALKWLRLSAERGNAQGQSLLGFRLREGQSLPADYAEALVWAHKAAAQGDRAADNLIGLLYDGGQGVPEDPVLALEWYRKAAALGFSAAMRHIGNAYYSGRGIPQDYGQALDWYRKATDRGDILATRATGLMYLRGQGTATDYAQAVTWLRKAADSQDSTAEFWLGKAYMNGWGVPKDPAQGVAWFQRAVDHGETSATSELAIAYRNGVGVAQDYAKAISVFKKGAEDGDMVCQYGLGIMYWFGQGTPQDYDQAVRWIQKSADQNYAAGQSLLGVAYAQGHGAPKDPVEAAIWYRKAADQGDATAQLNLGLVYHDGRGVPRDPDQAFAWFRKSADQDNAIAERCLGLSYERGEGTAVDKAQARTWLSKAAAHGDEYATQEMARLDGKG